MEDEDVIDQDMNLSAPEYYKLVCCSTDKDIVLNDELVVFEFTGQAYNGNYPDKFINVIIGEIVTMSKSKIQGCWYLELAENCDKELYKIEPWKSFFTEVTVYDCCEECQPEKPLENRIYLRHLSVAKKQDPCYNVVKDYVNVMYRDVLKRMEGIEMCCAPNKNKALINYNIYLLESIYDKTACCPPCVSLNVFVPAGSLGNYTYIDCEGESIIVDVDNSIDMLQTICVCAKSYTGIIFNGTTTDQFLVTPLGISCVE